MADNHSVAAESNDEEAYEKRFEPVSERVRVEFNGTWVADSSNALIVYRWRLFDISPWSNL